MTTASKTVFVQLQNVGTQSRFFFLGVNRAIKTADIAIKAVKKRFCSVIRFALDVEWLVEIKETNKADENYSATKIYQKIK